jgi:hypothetical protein|tara:strand:+ start:940 stop:1080 length:141 start_codon:yes stop_codon:yes gene_type:complete
VESGALITVDIVDGIGLVHFISQSEDLCEDIKTRHSICWDGGDFPW